MHTPTHPLSRRQALEALIHCSEQLPGGYLGDRDEHAREASHETAPVRATPDAQPAGAGEVAV